MQNLVMPSLLVLYVVTQTLSFYQTTQHIRALFKLRKVARSYGSNICLVRMDSSIVLLKGNICLHFRESIYEISQNLLPLYQLVGKLSIWFYLLTYSDPSSKNKIQLGFKHYILRLKS